MEKKIINKNENMTQFLRYIRVINMKLKCLINQDIRKRISIFIFKQNVCVYVLAYNVNF